MNQMITARRGDTTMDEAIVIVRDLLMKNVNPEAIAHAMYDGIPLPVRRAIVKRVERDLYDMQAHHEQAMDMYEKGLKTC